MSFDLDISPLNEECQKMAEKELNETPETVEKSLKELRELIQGDETLNFADDDATLTIFLRPCKWYAKSAFELVKRIAEFKKKYHDQLHDLMPEDVKTYVIDYNVVNILKGRDHLGRRVLIVHCGETWDTSKVTSDIMFKIFFLIHESAVLEPETQVRGVVVIMDFKGLGMSQVRALSPAFSMKLLAFIQDAMPLRLKEVHMVNQPFIFNIVWKIFKPFIREKLSNRIFFHGSKMESLHKHLQPSHLPADYKGELPKIDYTSAQWYPALELYMDHMKKWSKFGYKQ
ncbi:unnamed protein product [Brassicogethes aeneus]|uniref:CRAL-TRIO domain-containing protein n=1 Tax=Brassicogethes aeneus TaxID=1431903 RepID=A0A9P0FJX1_BRAAE|nr:unnamed protein product [Brassicogethes aeneus]